MTENGRLNFGQADFYFYTAVCGGNVYGISRHVYIFTSLKHLMMLFGCSFSGLHFYTISQTQVTFGTSQLRFFKVKSLLTNVFNCLFVQGHKIVTFLEIKFIKCSIIMRISNDYTTKSMPVKTYTPLHAFCILIMENIRPKCKKLLTIKKFIFYT